MPTDAGQWVSSRAERFRFDAGGNALDLIYTTPFATAFGDFVAAVPLGEWLRERYPDIQGEIGDRELVDADALRGAIKGIAVALARGTDVRSEDIDAVNVYAATPDIPPVLAGSSRQAGRTGIRPGQALSAMAREAIRMFGPDGRERVRECSADDCQLVFYDDSRAGSRRWCSMQRCGNRAKVRAFRAKR